VPAHVRPLPSHPCLSMPRHRCPGLACAAAFRPRSAARATAVPRTRFPQPRACAHQTSHL
jgi:hypothetical protein